MTTLFRIVAVLALSFGLAACSDTDDTSDDAPLPDNPAAPLSNDEARDALLSVKDMPSGWAQDGEDGNGVPTSYLCDYEPQTQQVAGADRNFIFEDIEAAGTSVRVFANEQDAVSSYKQFDETLNGDCRGGVNDGEKYEVAPMSVPDLGDNSFGMRLDSESGASLAYIYVQRGPVFFSVVGGGYSAMSIDDLQPLAEKQLSKVDAALAAK